MSLSNSTINTSYFNQSAYQLFLLQEKELFDFHLNCSIFPPISLSFLQPKDSNNNINVSVFDDQVHLSSIEKISDLNIEIKEQATLVINTEPKIKDEDWINSYLVGKNLPFLNETQLENWKQLTSIFHYNFETMTLSKQLKLKQRLFLFFKYLEYDLNLTSAKFNAYLKWREENEIANLEQGNLSQSIINYLLTSKIAWIHGYDKFGRPTIVMIAGRHIPSNNINSAVRCGISVLEHAICAMPDNILEFCAIIDYQGFGYYNLDLTLTRNAIDTYQNYYPNRLGAVFLVNVPSVITMAWQICKKWLDPEFKNRIHFISDNKQLLEYFESSQIPQIFGGTSQKGIAPYNSPWQWEQNLFSINSE